MINDIATYQNNLWLSDKCLDYLSSRRISPGTIKHYGIGYFDGSKYDSYYDRMLFPIRNLKGEVLGYQGRAMYDWEAVNGKKYYHGSIDKATTLYGLYECAELAYNINDIIVVEGPFDVLACYECGIPAVALLGSSMSQEQGFILRVIVENITTWLDSDKAGDAGRLRIEKITANANLGYRHIKGTSKDPADIYQEYGYIGMQRYKEKFLGR